MNKLTLTLAGAIAALGACPGPKPAEQPSTLPATAPATEPAPPPATEPAAPASNPSEGAAMPEKTGRVVNIQETTAGTIDGWKITVGNIMNDTWTGPDGKERTGITAEIGVYDEKKAEKMRKTVGEGALLDIKDKKWRLDAVQAGEKNANGSIKLVELL